MATADAPTPLPGRASDADRERFVELLKTRSIEGRLSTETFAYRLERALAARSVPELEELVADVPSPGRMRRALMGAVGWVSRLTRDLQAAWSEPRVPVIALPAAVMTIGRASDCDCVIAEPSVSRRHASLRRAGDRWLLRDLGSSNGTRVNGIRVTDEVEIRPGDQLNLGGVRFRAACRAR
jgi:hypothetical protein